ncbi:hypothetical protein [Streptomyces spectabilis]|uniref:DUF4760 domain-containing protein n=1 Tax=Streptomyces spectabilis TaxID=68270 RepID=A0A516R2P8_STRST|nr:hypothetical protein [Streptomyces spectabilis]QDQ09938.1 hypothetical protein FH965_04665 [Streptomyces spectabilis]
MESASWAVTALSMLVAMSALMVSLWSARRQAADAQKAAIMRFVAEFIVVSRTEEFQAAQRAVVADLKGESAPDPQGGISGLPEPLQSQVKRVGGFYQDLGTLVVLGVVPEYLVVALHYRFLRDVWLAIWPYLERERIFLNSQNAGSVWGSFEHLAACALNTPFAHVSKRFRRRTYVV